MRQWAALNGGSLIWNPRPLNGTEGFRGAGSAVSRGQMGRSSLRSGNLKSFFFIFFQVWAKSKFKALHGGGGTEFGVIRDLNLNFASSLRELGGKGRPGKSAQGGALWLNRLGARR